MSKIYILKKYRLTVDGYDITQQYIHRRLSTQFDWSLFDELVGQFKTIWKHYKVRISKTRYALRGREMTTLRVESIRKGEVPFK